MKSKHQTLTNHIDASLSRSTSTIHNTAIPPTKFEVKFIQPSEFNGLSSHSCQRDRFIQSVLSSDLIRRMTPTSALNKMIRSRKALVLISKRGISTGSILSQPATLVELAFTKNPSVRQAPACGWRKSIVSSSSSVVANISNSSSLEGISMTKKELQKTETEELKLEVDMEQCPRANRPQAEY